MNILGLHYFPNFINANNHKKQNNNTNPLKLNSLNQDIVTFKGKEFKGQEEIEELKKLEPSAQKSFRVADVVHICCDYFGFTEEDGRHKKLTGPYGQVIVVKNDNKDADPACVRELLQAIRMVDEFNGELIVAKTPEEIERWKKKVNTEKPKNNKINLYAENLKKNRKTEQSVQNKRAQSATNNEIMNLRKRLLLFDITAKETILSEINGRFKGLERDLKENKVDIPSEDISEIRKELNSKLSELDKIQSIENKLNQNIKLTKEEKEKIEKFMEKEFDLSNIEELIGIFEEIYINQLDEKDKLVVNLNTVVDNFEKETNSQFVKLQEIEKVLKTKKSIIANKLNEDVTNTIKQNLKEIKELLSLINKYKAFDEAKKEAYKAKYTPLQLSQNIKKIEESVKKFSELYNKTLNLYIQEVLPILNALELEKNKTMPDNPISSNINDAKHKSLSTVVKEYSGIKNVLNENVQDISQLKDAKIKNLKEKLGHKLSPLPILSVIDSVFQIVDKKFDVEKFDLIVAQKLSSQEFIDAIIKDVCQSEDYLRVRNAAEFAILYNVYNLNNHQNEEVYNLNLKQIKMLYSAIANGQKEISIPVETQTIKIDLIKLPNLNEIESQFNEFNIKLSSLPPQQLEKVVNEVLKYAPSYISKKELKMARELLLADGSYYKLMLADNASEKLEKVLLQTFWTKYKNKTGKDFVEDVMKNYQTQKEAKQVAQMHQMKLKSIEEVDWTL